MLLGTANIATVPETLGKLITLSAVGSITLNVVSLSSKVAPSNIMEVIPLLVSVVKNVFNVSIEKLTVSYF